LAYAFGQTIIKNHTVSLSLFYQVFLPLLVIQENGTLHESIEQNILDFWRELNARHKNAVLKEVAIDKEVAVSAAEACLFLMKKENISI